METLPCVAGPYEREARRRGGPVERPLVEAREADAIPSIPPAAIEPFLTQPLVIDSRGRPFFKTASAALDQTATEVSRFTLVFLEADDEAFYGFWTARGVLKQLDPFIGRDKYELGMAQAKIATNFSHDIVTSATAQR